VVERVHAVVPAGSSPGVHAAWRGAWRPLLVAVAFYGSAQLGYRLTVPGTNVGVFWPAAGLSLGLLLVLGLRAWTGVAAGAAALLLPDLLSRLPPGAALVTGLGEIAADVVPPLAGAWAVRRALRGRDPLASAPDLFRLLFWGAVVAQLLAASMGTAALWAGGMARPSALWGAWETWFMSDAASAVLVALPCLAWCRRAPRERPHRHALLAGLALACGLLAFFGGSDPRLRTFAAPLGLLVVLYATFTQGARGATLTALVFSATAVWATTTGRAIFPAGTVQAQALLLDAYLVALGLMGAVLAAVLAERQASAARLGESEARLRAVLDAIPTPIAMSGPAGRVEFMNRRFVGLFGWGPADLPDVATWFLRAFPDPGYREQARRRWGGAEAAARTAGSDALVTDLEVTCKDGAVRTVDAVGTSTGDRMVVLFVDLTERRRAEEKHAELQRQLAQAQRIESVGRLAGGVAHDLNNLLSPVIAYTDLLLSTAQAGSEAVADLSEIKRAAERARDLTRQLLALGRKQVLDVHAVDLRQEVVRLERLLRLALREDVRLELRVPPALGPVRVDPSQLDQVLMNLAVNARQAMPGAGTLVVELADEDLDDQTSRPHPEIPAGRWVRLSVSDTGVGMAPEVLQRVFEPFFTTKRGEGTGLGLSIVHGIVSQHGGHVAVDSRPGRGSTFHVYLPRAGVEAAPAGPPPASPPPPAPGRGTILLAEDEEVVRRAAVRVLERLGYRVLAFPDATSCLAGAAAEPGPVDLLLTDVVMPGLDGRQLHLRLQGLRPGLRVLYMSGYPGDLVVHRGVVDDGAGFLQKPFSADGLAEAVRLALAAAGP
jgi:PAS domain S-box-containing protein